MTVGSSLFLIAVGAILYFAVTATISGISVATVGLILMIVGIVALVLSLFWMYGFAARRRERMVVRDRVVRDPEGPVVRDREGPVVRDREIL